MRLTQLCFSALVAFSLLGAQASADIISSNLEPSGPDVLVDASALGGAQNTLINAGAAQGARGTQFSVGVTGEEYDVSGFTIRANAADTFVAGEEFIVAFYTGIAGTFTAPTSFANVNPGYLDANSGLTLIGQETFLGTTITGDAPDGQVGVGDYVTFDFTNDIRIDGGDDITALVFTNFAFSQREGGNANGGGRLQFRESTTTLGPSGSRDLNFSVSGTLVPVPEPTSLALLGFGALGLVARRRRS